MTTEELAAAERALLGVHTRPLAYGELVFEHGARGVSSDALCLRPRQERLIGCAAVKYTSRGQIHTRKRGKNSGSCRPERGRRRITRHAGIFGRVGLSA
jgi:hypothetical protein